MKRALIIGGAVLAVILLAASIALSIAASRARPSVEKALAERFDSDVELGSFQASLLPSVSLSGERLTLRHRHRTDVPPLIYIARFTAETNLISLLFGHVSLVKLEGMQLHMAPKGSGPAAKPSTGNGGFAGRLTLDKVVADGTLLRVLSKKPGREPLEFDIQRLTISSLNMDRPMEFDARLQNAKPPGLIVSKGKFGPWSREEPGDTAVSGEYTFKDADLSVFKGISGKLASFGKYAGQLSRIEVSGETNTPDFTVRLSGHPVALKTTFSAVVDGTNGDTVLSPVEARFLNSVIVAKGGVEGTPGKKGKTVSLDVDVTKARMEDLLLLAVKSSPPPMLGPIQFKTKLRILPGDVDIAEKLELDGNFHLHGGRFAKLDVRRKVEDLSRRGKGDPEGVTGQGSDVTDLRGRFGLKNGMLALSGLTFQIPGVGVFLDGTLGLRSEELALKGRVEMEAKVSETVTGVKSVLLKAVDPFFKKKDKGAVIPIRVGGTMRDPSFGLSLGKK